MPSQTAVFNFFYNRKFTMTAMAEVSFFEKYKNLFSVPLSASNFTASPIMSDYMDEKVAKHFKQELQHFHKKYNIPLKVDLVSHHDDKHKKCLVVSNISPGLQQKFNPFNTVQKILNVNHVNGNLLSPEVSLLDHELEEVKKAQNTENLVQALFALEARISLECNKDPDLFIKANLPKSAQNYPFAVAVADTYQRLQAVYILESFVSSEPIYKSLPDKVLLSEENTLLKHEMDLLAGLKRTLIDERRSDYVEAE